MTPGGPALRILLLEDQALVRAGMRALMEISAPNSVVEEASSSEEAIAGLAAAPVDVAFLDIHLKGKGSGLDVLRHIGAAGLSTRAIMLSAHDEEAMVMNCLRLGASGYILKDMDAEGLFRRALDTVFSGRIFLPQSVTHVASVLPSSPPADSVASLQHLGVRGRALEVLYYLCQGFSNKLIAHEMGVAESTVANEYITKLFRLFRVKNRAGLIVEVSRRGLSLPPPEQFERKNTTV